MKSHEPTAHTVPVLNKPTHHNACLLTGKLYALALTLFLFAMFTLPVYSQEGITDLNGDEYGDISRARAVNADGTVVVGSYDEGATVRAFRWTQAGGLADLGTLGGTSAYANGVNGDGTVVVGTSHTGSELHAFRWTQASGMIDLGTIGGINSHGNAVNNQGNVVVGRSQNVGSVYHAFRWVHSAGTSGTMYDLGILGGVATSTSEAISVNAEGNVVVGQSDTASGFAHAFRWVQTPGDTAGTMYDLGTLAGGTNSEAQDTNAEGNVVVGTSTSAEGSRAFRWVLTDSDTGTGTMTSLGVLAEDSSPQGISTRGIAGPQSYAYGVNAAGDVVVGRCSNSSGLQAFRWTQAAGMQTVEDWLTDNGVDVNPNAPKATVALDVDAAGDTVVGMLDNAHAFLAVAGSGLLDTVEFNRSLSSSAGVATLASQEASMVIHGAHSSPMRGLLSSGRQSFWTSGDAGYTDNDEMDGDIGSLEIGYARGLTDTVMAKLALGLTSSKSDTLFGGDIDADGTYIIPEMILNFKNAPLYVTLSGYYNWGEAAIKRGYNNAGNREYSRGSADTSTVAYRGRIDWLNAFSIRKTAFTPYASMTYTRATIDAYTETGGNFPARWNQKKEYSTEARYGLDAVCPVRKSLTLLGRLEGVHRFDDTDGGASGIVPNTIGSFNFAGTSVDRNWLRAGAGIEAELSRGVISLMINGTTRDDGPRYWLAFGYRLPF